MSTRRDFLASSAVVALTPSAASAAPPAKKPGPAPTFAPLHFDLAAFEARAGKTADHHHLFASTKLDGGRVIEAMNNTYNAYVEGLGQKSPSLAMAAVLYHGISIVLAFNDSVWNDLIVPARAHADQAVRKDLGDVVAGKGNPYLHPDITPTPDSASVEKLVALGSTFFVCNNATMGMADMIGGALKRPAAAIYAQLKAGLVPGAMLVPAGVWAVHALQEAHFTYLAA